MRGLCLPAPRSPEGLLSRPWLWGHSRPWTTCSSSRRRWAARAGGRVRAVAEGPPPSAALGRSASPGGWADVARPPWCWAGQRSCRTPSRCCLISQQFKKEKNFFLNTSSSFAELPHFHPRHSIGRSFRDGGDLWLLAVGPRGLRASGGPGPRGTCRQSRRKRLPQADLIPGCGAYNPAAFGPRIEAAGR